MNELCALGGHRRLVDFFIQQGANIRALCVKPGLNHIWVERLRKDYNVVYFGNNAYQVYMKKLSKDFSFSK